MRLKLNIETAVLYLDYSHMRDISLYIAGRLLKAKHTAVLSVLHTGVGRVVQSRRYSYIDIFIPAGVPPITRSQFWNWNQGETFLLPSTQNNVQIRMKLSDVDDVGASEEQSDSAGRFQINSVRSRRQSTVRFVEEDNVSTESLVLYFK